MNERLVKLIVEMLGVKAEEVQPLVNFKDDLGADSLDMVEMAMALEDEFRIEIADEDLGKLKTVHDVNVYLTTRGCIVSP